MRLALFFAAFFALAVPAYAEPILCEEIVEGTCLAVEASMCTAATDATEHYDVTQHGEVIDAREVSWFGVAGDDDDSPTPVAEYIDNDQPELEIQWSGTQGSAESYCWYGGRVSSGGDVTGTDAVPYEECPDGATCPSPTAFDNGWHQTDGHRIQSKNGYVQGLRCQNIGDCIVVDDMNGGHLGSFTHQSQNFLETCLDDCIENDWLGPQEIIDNWMQPRKFAIAVRARASADADLEDASANVLRIEDNLIRQIANVPDKALIDGATSGSNNGGGAFFKLANYDASDCTGTGIHSMTGGACNLISNNDCTNPDDEDDCGPKMRVKRNVFAAQKQNPALTGVWFPLDNKLIQSGGGKCEGNVFLWTGTNTDYNTAMEQDGIGPDGLTDLQRITNYTEEEEGYEPCYVVAKRDDVCTGCTTGQMLAADLDVLEPRCEERGIATPCSFNDLLTQWQLDHTADEE